MSLTEKKLLLLSLFGSTSTQVRNKQDWSQEFIFLPPQAAVLLGSDADSDGVKASIEFPHSKLSDFVLYVGPNAWECFWPRWQLLSHTLGRE